MLALLSLIDGTYVLAAIELALAAAVISGYYCLPFAWFTLRRHRAAAEAPVDVVVDAEGLEFTNAGVRLELPWVRIASVKETPTVFFLMSRYPRAFLLPKRAFDKGQLAAFRKLAASLTTFRPVLSRRPPNLTAAARAVQSASAGRSGPVGMRGFDRGW